MVTQLLEALKVDPATLSERLDYILRTSPKASIFGGGAGQIFITPRVKRIMDLANEEASRLKDEYISTEHMFMAILSERNTACCALVGRCRVDSRPRLRCGHSVSAVVSRVTDPQAETRFPPLWKNIPAI